VKRTDLTYRLTKVGGKVASVAVCALTGAMMFGAVAAMAPAYAANVLIVDYNLVSGIASNLGNQQTLAGNTFTIVNGTAASNLPNSLAGFQQVWDLGANQPITYASAYTSYLQGGGDLFLMGENAYYGATRDAALTPFLAALGGGTVTTAASDSGNTQTMAAQFLSQNQSAAVSYAAVGSFSSLGTGTCMTSDGIGGCGAAVWGVGSLSNAMKGALVSVLDVNFLQTEYLQPSLIQNLIGYLGLQQEISQSTTINATFDAAGLAAHPVTLRPVFDGGTLVLDGTSLLPYSFSIKSTNGAIDLAGQSATIANSIVDASTGTPGSLTIADSGQGGVLTLTGSNSYSGSTTINNGATLALAGSGSIATSSSVIDNGSFDISGTTSGTTIQSLAGTGTVALGSQTLTLSNAHDNFAGRIGGSGGLTMAGGSETLSGVNGYSGQTGIASSAMLALAGNGSIAASSGVTDNGSFDISATTSGATIQSLAGTGAVALGGQTLALSNANDTFAGAIHGSGGVTLAGGSETLSGSNDYSGTTTINSGATLALSGNGSIAASGGVVDNGAFDISATNSGAAIQSLSGNGSVQLGGQTLTLSNANDLFVGSIHGTGGLSVAGGTETLSGSNDYSGATTVSAGMLQAGQTNALSAASATTVASGATLDLNNYSQTVASLSGAGHVTLGEATLTTGGNNSSTSFSGDIAGTGGLAKTGSGTLTLSGVNSYAGGTTINGGTVQVAADSALGAANGELTLNNGTLSTTATQTSARNIALAGNGTLAVAGGTILTENGVISGSGNLSKTGSGTLVLVGVNSYSGGNTINGGAVQVASDAALGSANGGLTLNGGTLQTTANITTARAITLTGNGALDTASGTSLSSSGLVSGSGTLFKSGAGTLTLSGSNTYQGGTVVNGGTLAVAADAALGAASGNITLASGILQTTADMSTNRKITLLGEGALQTNAGTTFTQSGGIDGSGRLFKLGGGTLVLTGSNTYSGGTIVDGGDVEVASGSSLGSGAVVLNGGTLHTTATLAAGQQLLVSGNAQAKVDAGTTALLSGTISDVGSNSCFSKTGAGTLNLTGSASLHNGTCVQEGMLRANGLLDSSVQVAAAGTLRGIGHINGNVSVSGTLAPGNSPGLLTQSGTTTMQTGSTFQEDIDGTSMGNGASHYSHLDISGGQFVINSGVSLAPQLRGITGNASNTFTPQVGDVFRVVTADGGIVGRFNTLNQPTSGLAPNTRFTAFYSSNSVDLALTPSSYASYLGQGNVNARAAGGVVDKLLSHQDDGTATQAQSGLLYAVATTNAQALPTLATALAGEIHGALAAAAPQAGRGLQNLVATHLSTTEASSPEVAPGQELWVDVSTQRGDFDSDGISSGYSTKRDQYTLGRDLLGTGRSRLGIGFSYATNNVSSSNAGTGSVDDSLGFIYGQIGAGQVIVDGLAAYGTSRWKTQRSDPLQQTPALSSTADGRESLAGLGVRLPLQVGAQTLEPFASLLWQRSSRDGTGEGTASLAALSFQGYSANGTRVLAGLAGGSLAKDPLSAPVTYQFRVALGRDTGGEGQAAVQGSLAGEDLTVSAPHSGRNFVQMALSGTAQLSRSAYASFGLNGEVGTGRSEYGATAGLNLRF